MPPTKTETFDTRAEADAYVLGIEYVNDPDLSTEIHPAEGGGFAVDVFDRTATDDDEPAADPLDLDARAAEIERDVP